MLLALTLERYAARIWSYEMEQQIGRNEADFINALNDMFEKYTEKEWMDIDIGMPPDPSVVED